MCFSSGSADSKIAKQQRADEVARQARIAAGMKSINGAFDGTTKGINAATSYDPAATYYNADGTKYSPMTAAASAIGGLFGGARGPTVGGTPFETPAQAAAAGHLFTGTEHSGGFDDAFYAKQKQNYIDFATPELERQTSKARDNLIYALSRTGNLDSSAAIKKDNELAVDADKARIGIADQGLTFSNQTRSNVENVRSGLVSELNATGDSTAAAQGALRQAANINMPQGYSPVGNLFADFAQAVGQIGSNSGNGYSGFLKGGAPALFSQGAGAGSSRVVGG